MTRPDALTAAADAMDALADGRVTGLTSEAYRTIAATLRETLAYLRSAHGSRDPEHHATYTRERYADHRAEKICAKCGVPSGEYWACARCREKDAEKSRSRRARR